jgi:hypothetical protein
MKKLNPLFIIGAAGIIITAVLHVIAITQTSANIPFFIIYPVFAALLTIGIVQIILERRLIKIRIRK